MPNPVLPRRSFTPNAVPIAASEISAPGELVINWADGVAYTKDSAGNLISWSLGGGSGGGGGEDALLRSIFVPPAPTGLTAIAGDAQVALSWTAPTGVIAQAPITDYREQFSTDGGTTWTTFSAAASTATSATVTGLNNGTAYVFRVAAINAVGVGAYTAASAAVTPTAFSPTSIAGLQLWLDASDGSTLYDATSGGSLVAADGGVARWEDKSGNARHATQGTSANRPARKTAIQGGKDVLRFDGSNDSLSISGSASTMKFLHSADNTVFLVLSRPAGGYQPLIGTGDSGTASVGFNWHVADGSSSSDKLTVVAFRGVSGTNVFLQATANGFLPSGFSVLSHVVKPADGTASNRSAVRCNGGAAVTGNASTSAVSTANSTFDFKIAGDNYSLGETFAAFDCAEIIIYNSALSDANREAVENYLIAKWGIT